MTSLASLPVVASATPVAPSPRDAQARSVDDFGAALARSRSSSRGGSSGNTAAEEATETASAIQSPRRRSIANSAADHNKEHSPAELLAIAMLTPAFLASSPRAAAPLDAPRSGSAAAASVAAAQETTASLPQGLLAGAQAEPAGNEAAATAKKAEVQAAAPRLHGAAGRTDAGKSEAPGTRSTQGATAPVPAAALPPATASSTTPAPAPAPAAPSPTAAVQQAADAAASQQQSAEHEDIALSSTATPSTSAAPAPGLTALVPTLTPISAAPPAPAAPAHVPLLSVAPLVGSEEWGAAVGQQMIRMNASGEHVAELNLNPAGLGPLKLSLTLGDNQAQAMFVSAHESVRKAIEAALPQLRSQLAEQGISLGQASVDAGAQQQQQQQHAADRDAGLDLPAAMQGARIAPRPVAADAMPGTRSEHPRARSGGVDTFA